MKSQRGFTLVEMLVVISIILVTSVMLFRNLSGSKVNLEQARSQLIEVIRDAQGRALTGARYSNSLRCGYGVRLQQTGYSLYVGPIAAYDAAQNPTTTCTPLSRAYDAGDTIITTTTFPVNSLELIGGPVDIFFEPPDATVSICPSLGACSSSGTATIVVRRAGATCTTSSPSSDCKIFNVESNGRITTQ